MDKNKNIISNAPKPTTELGVKLVKTKEMIDKFRDQLHIVLPNDQRINRLIRGVTTMLQRNSKLMECSANSLKGAILQIAQLDLETDAFMGEAHIVPFNNKKTGKTEATFIVGYRGLCKLARRSNQIDHIEARVVHDTDEFEVKLGTSPEIIHKVKGLNDDKKVVAFYALAKFKNGELQFEVMSKQQVDSIRDRSFGKNSDAWVYSYDEMGKKTVVKRLAKMLPLTVEAQSAVTLDDQAEVGKSQGLSTLVDPDEIVDVETESTELTVPQRMNETEVHNSNQQINGALPKF